MVKVNVHLTFPCTTEKAFNFYKSVFKSEFGGGGIFRFKDAPALSDILSMDENEANLVMHVSLPILAGHVLTGSDLPKRLPTGMSMGNNVSICLSADSKDEVQPLFDALSEGGRIVHALEEMAWGDFYGSCSDQFGVQWVFVCSGENCDKR